MNYDVWCARVHFWLYRMAWHGILFFTGLRVSHVLVHLGQVDFDFETGRVGMWCSVQKSSQPTKASVRETTHQRGCFSFPVRHPVEQPTFADLYSLFCRHLSRVGSSDLLLGLYQRERDEEEDEDYGGDQDGRGAHHGLDPVGLPPLPGLRPKLPDGKI